MKTILLLSGVASLLAFQANAADIKPYVGLDAGYSHVEYPIPGYLASFSENFGIMNFNVGTKIGKYFGLEVSAQASTTKEDNTNYGVELSYNSVGIDALGYVPIGNKVEIFASAGVGYYTFDLSKDMYDNFSTHIQYSDTAFRIGGGAQYNFNNHWAMRGMVKYAFINADYIVDSVTEVSVGIRYSF